MPLNKDILIVGAGPAGLSMAIFLHDHGFYPRIIDKKKEISKYSKALGVNPMTLDLFSESGITDRFLSNGRKMTAINIWYKNNFIYKNELSKINHRFNFMLIQPQKDSEEILLDEARQRNINVEYSTEFFGYTKSTEKYLASINSNNTASAFDYIIAADGARSKIRKQTDIRFSGFTYDDIWELYDIELDTNLNANEGHIFLFKDGGMIMIRLADNIWRIAGNLKSILNYLPPKTKTGKIAWESTFSISHNVAEQLTKENIVLIGDAAHLHSPVGARGMNLGIEDAFISSQLIKNNKIETYNNLRKPYLTRTIKRINTMTMGLAGNNPASKFGRNYVAKHKWIYPMVIPGARKFIMGLNK